eukprot:scaffold109_cov193-Alexandrium_tamarense.AAC.10
MTMWWFSSSATTTPKANSIEDEETAMVSSVRQETHKSYSSRPTKDDATDAGVGGGVNTATSHAQHVVVDDINSRPYHNDIESNGCNNRRKRKKQRGVVYFRSIEPSDRDAIHRLHEDWFPVDYNADFFDSLCNRRVMPGTNEPLYCTVACYKELDDDQFEEMIERNATGYVRDGGTFSFSSKHKRQFTCVTDDNIGDCMLWEADSVDDREGVYVDNNGYEGEAESGSSVQTQAPNTSLLSTSSSPPLYCSPTNEDNPTTNGDMMDNEESFTSIYETKEREKMERFYSNGFRFDTDHYVNKDVSQHRKRGHNETHLNDVGERIIGCLVGSFLSSAIPSSKHSTTLDEKLGRDETAALLVPEPENYSKMFYIMTLGTVREFRRTGLGSLLVERVVDMINTTPECGALLSFCVLRQLACEMAESDPNDEADSSNWISRIQRKMTQVSLEQSTISNTHRQSVTKSLPSNVSEEPLFQNLSRHSKTSLAPYLYTSHREEERHINRQWRILREADVRMLKDPMQLPLYNQPSSIAINTKRKTTTNEKTWSVIYRGMQNNPSKLDSGVQQPSQNTTTSASRGIQCSFKAKHEPRMKQSAAIQCKQPPKPITEARLSSNVVDQNDQTEIDSSVTAEKGDISMQEEAEESPPSKLHEEPTTKKKTHVDTSLYKVLKVSSPRSVQNEPLTKDATKQYTGRPSKNQ